MSKEVAGTKRLLEDSLLDVYGLLDDSQREQFEQAFRAAPPALQASIRREQLRFAKFTGFLPEMDVPPELRSKVMVAVREAVSGGSAGGLRLTATPDPEPMDGRRRVSPLWRLVSLATATAAVVLGGTILQMRADFERIQRFVYNDEPGTVIPRGLSFQDFLFDAPKFSFQRTEMGGAELPQDTRATLFYDEARKTGVVITSQLPEIEGVSYVIGLVNQQGEVVETLKVIMNAANNLVGTRVEFIAQAGLRVAICTQDAGGNLGRPLLITASIRA